MNIFGWYYPPGTERDPRAPWNAKDDDPELDEPGDLNELDDTDLIEGWDQ